MTNVIGNNQYKMDYVIEPELLFGLYWGNQYSAGKIANIFDWNRTSILRRMEKYNIQKRTRGQALSLRQQGKNNCNWRGGKTKKIDLLRHSNRWKQWRQQVFERDNHTCQNCGIKGGTLHPHHIKPKSRFLDLIFDVDNGITLCYECHMNVHRNMKV